MTQPLEQHSLLSKKCFSCWSTNSLWKEAKTLGHFNLTIKALIKLWPMQKFSSFDMEALKIERSMVMCTYFNLPRHNMGRGEARKKIASEISSDKPIHYCILCFYSWNAQSNHELGLPPIFCPCSDLHWVMTERHLRCVLVFIHSFWLRVDTIHLPLQTDL